MIVKTVHSDDPDTKPTTVLTANLIREFEKRQLERVEKRAAGLTRLAAIQRIRAATASYVRQARSIVALRKMNEIVKALSALWRSHYAKFKNGRLTDFGTE